MKKTILWIAALLAVATLAGCNKSLNVENEQERIFSCWRAVSEYFGVSDLSTSWSREEEAWASYVLNWLVNIWNALEEDMVAKHVECVIDMVDKSVTIQEGSAEIANPASIFCEKKGGTLQIETAEDWGQYWICLFNDGSYCEEWAYFRNECQPGDIIYNTASGDIIPEINESEENNFAVDYWTSDNYSLEELSSAVETIMDTIKNEWNVKVDMKEIRYLWDAKASSELDYCKSLNAEVEDCVVFTSDFFIPEQDAVMAGAFEPNTTLTDYEWYLGRTAGGEWNVLTAGY